MKRFRFRVGLAVICLCAALLIGAGCKRFSESGPGVEVATTEGDTPAAPASPACGMTGGLDNLPARTLAPFLGGPPAMQMENYGIFFEQATGKITRADQSGALLFEYDVPPAQSWGNWLSFRREFSQKVDLTGCTGVEVEIRNERPSDAQLRLTLCDVTSPADSSDEMWWFDFPRGSLSRTGEVLTLRAPFRRFEISSGSGTRQNDGKLDLTRITAYEINVLSAPGERPNGAFVLQAIRAYGD